MSKSNTRVLLLTLVLLSALFVSNAWPQNIPAPVATAPAAQAATPKPEKDPLSRETPQGMVFGLMRALAARDYERAVRFFETDHVPDPETSSGLSGPELARRFQQVLDRAGEVLTPAQLSENPSGAVNDGLDENLDRFGVVKTPTREVPLLAARVTRDGKSLWLVSEQTLNDIPTLASSTAGSWIDQIPKGPTVGGAPLSHWLVLVTAACLSIVIGWVLSTLFGPLARAIRRGGPDTRVSRFIERSAGPLCLLVSLVIFGIAVELLGVAVVARYRVLFVVRIMGWFAVTWLLWRWANAAGEGILERMSRQGQLAAYSAVSFSNRAFKALLGLLLVAMVLRAFGVNLTAGFAALGIGGLAVALGAQKLLENVIGGLTLIADRPVQIGDYCRIGNTSGVIEEIGIRSTRIRTLNRTIMCIPNGELSSLHIENYSQRDRFWFHPILNLRYETSAEQMQQVLDALREMLKLHPKVQDESSRVRFIGLGPHSLDIEIFSYVYAKDYAEFLEAQEGLLLNCMKIVQGEGPGFAFPSQTIYLARDGSLDETRSREVDELMRRAQAT